MPRFYFNVADDYDFPDSSGLILRNAAEAKEHAENLAVSIAEKANRRLGPAIIIVTDAEGNRLFEVPVAARDQSRAGRKH
jgi:hypothetical protein